MRGRGRRATALLASWVALCQLACGSGPEVILRSADGADVTAPEIDRDPLQLLPPGSVAWFHLDVGTAALSDLGQYVLADLEARMPLPEGAGFSLRRDVAQLSVAIYSMQGVDFAGVAIGHFDPAKIGSAALEYKGGSLAPPLVRSEYAGRTLFTAQNVGFSILTPRTALFGNEIGMRRCLDRIAEARVADDIPPWVKELLATPNAAFSLGGDLSANAVTAALPRRLALLDGASQVQAVGNFTPPGINLAGTIHHGDPSAASRSATALLEVGGSLNVYAQLLGLGQPLRKLEAQAVGPDTQLVLAVDGAAVKLLMRRFLPAPPPAVQHSGPGWAAAPRTSHPALAQVTP
ncbi:MAG TPA: hypothetical protein VJU61_27105 [Polyangiaceae bacterium]|nr:hypothetical protein [Polyangiaceae bacterium]